MGSRQIVEDRVEGGAVSTDYQADIAAVQRISAVPTILDVVCRATGMGFAAVARVTADRWIACQVLDNVHFGLPAGGELKVETTLCHEVRQHRQVVVIDNVAEDAVYASHHTPSIYGLQSYISVPIVLPDGTFFGTLCAIDSKPAKLNNPEVLGTFKLFAELIAYHLEADKKLVASKASLDIAEQASNLRDEFIAILGHDLRNPLASIDGGANILEREPQTDKAKKVLSLMRASVVRMSGLIDNVLDFARGRLGSGITVQRDARELGPTLDQVIAEIRSGNPHRQINANFELNDVIDADHARIAQMFSNLLGNAIMHGDEAGAITVNAAIVDGHLDLSVSNGGAPIPEETMGRLFQPFYRGDPSSNVQGLGLGLYIASQIAQAHGGRLDVTSDTAETKFTFRMPVS